MIAAFVERAHRPARCPYNRPFEHPAGCGCGDCGQRASRRFARGCIVVVLVISTLIIGVTL